MLESLTKKSLSCGESFYPGTINEAYVARELSRRDLHLPGVRANGGKACARAQIGKAGTILETSGCDPER
jgi:hypothetical protein